MVDGTGMCGGCRVKIGEQVKFACVDGPDFDGHQVDFDDLMARLRRYKPDREGGARSTGRKAAACGGAPAAPAARPRPPRHRRPRPGAEPWPRRRRSARIPQERTPMREQDPQVRAQNFEEVACGYRLEDALREAERCLHVRRPALRARLPGGHRHPRLHPEDRARRTSTAPTTSSPTPTCCPSICGRVCPQENQCEGVCTVGETLEPVAIGRLERFVGDMAIARRLGQHSLHRAERASRSASSAPGPAGMACAADMAKAGCEVTVYEAFHEPGGVLQVRHPRLPPAQRGDRRRDRQAEEARASSSSATRWSAACSPSSR